MNGVSTTKIPKTGNVRKFHKTFRLFTSFSGGTLAKLVYFEPTDTTEVEKRSPEDQQVLIK